MRTRTLSFIALLIAAAPALAISSYRSHIPNGISASCQTCHISSLGGEGWNAFGKDVLRQDPAETEADISSNNQNVHYTRIAGPVWSENNWDLCHKDSDNDGQTNGQELGDPGCIWAGTGTPPRTSAISRPGDPASTSANPDGIDPAEGEGEGQGGEGEGEGQVTPPPGGCPGCTSTGDAAIPVAGLVGALALARRRRASTVGR